MKYQILGQTVPAVEVTLDKNESIYTQNGGMTYESDGIKMDTSARGGIGKSIGRMFSGESLFMATYTAEKDNAMVAFASTVPGNIVAVKMEDVGGKMILQKGAFLCAQPTINTSVKFTKKFSTGLFGGEGFILQEAEGTGMLFLEVDGDPIEKELQSGEILKVDTGNVVGFAPTVQYEIETVKGIKNIFLGGEGLFLTKLVGPGKVILQTQNFSDFANKIKPYLPNKTN